LADDSADLVPDGRLSDEVDVGVGVGLPDLPLHNPAGLASARGITGARHGIAERIAFAVLRILGQRTVGETLLIAQLHAAEIEHAVLHGACDALASARVRTLIERGYDAQCQMQASAAVADLGAGDERRTVVKAGRGCGAAGALSDVLVDLAIFVGARTETLDRGVNHPRVELLDAFPGEAHAVEHARREVLH